MRAHPIAADTLLAVIVAGLSIAGHWTNSEASTDLAPPSVFGTIMVCLSTLPIALRRKAPVETLAIVAGTQFLSEILNIGGAGWMGVLISVYSLAAHTGGRQRVNATFAFVIACTALLVIGFLRDQVPLGGVISTVVVLVGAFILGDNLQRRRLHLADLAERAERAERERELLARQAVQDERALIARELHDVVAHSVSVMVIQSAVARRSLHNAPEQAQQALTELEATGRQAMQELRRVLGVLRTEHGDDHLLPQPTLQHVRALVESDPSLPVQLTESGTPHEELPPSVGLSMYRIVQEALTNVRKHAGPVGVVKVDVAYHPAEVVVHVIDDGRGAAVATNTRGQGLIGMRERMALCGGTVAAGPRVGGGWQVRAVVPVSPT